MARGNINNYQPALNQAYNNTGLGGQATNFGQLTSGDINQYLNPYTDRVVGALQSASNQNFQMNQLPAIQAKFVSAGQSRSPQEMQATNNALYLNNQALDQSVAGALNQGYQSAVTTAGQQQGLQLQQAQANRQAAQQAGAQWGALGQLQQQLGGYDVGQLAAAGQGQDTANQANINAAMNNFYAQQQWPYQNLAFASNIIRGQPVASNTQTVGSGQSPGYTPSPLASFIGTTLGATALTNKANSNNSGSSSTGSIFGLAKGGRVSNDNEGALSAMARRTRSSLMRVA